MQRWLFSCENLPDGFRKKTTVPTISTLNYTIAFVWILLTIAVHPVFADGGVVLFKSTTKDYVVTVFQSPAPLRAGVSDISALIQKRTTGEPILDCHVKLTAIPIELDTSTKTWQPPCCSMHNSDQNVAVGLARGHSQNRILYGALITLPQPGRWRIQLEVLDVNVHDTIEHEVTVISPVSPLQAYWPLLVLPFVIGGLIGLHQWRARKCQS